MNLNKHHRFITNTTGCYVGQIECYESSSEMLFKTQCIDIDNNKVHRLCTDLGQDYTDWLKSDLNNVEIKEDLDDKGENVLYSYCDSVFILTRKKVERIQGWQGLHIG